MPTENILEVPEGSSSYTGVHTFELLLQQHRSLLLRSTLTQTTYRLINMLLIVLALTSHYVFYMPIAVVLIAALAAGIWSSERSFVSSRVSAVENALGKKNRLQSEDAYVAYRFALSSVGGNFLLVRFEPALWFVVITAISGMRLVLRG